MNSEPNQQPDGLPDGFELRNDGIFLLPDSDSDCDTPVWLCSPLKVTAQTFDSRGSRWGRLITAKNEAGQIHEFVMSAKDISKVAKLVDELHDRGLHIDGDKANRSAVSNMLMNWKPTETVLLTEKVGWADDTYKTFLLADGSAVGRQKAIYLPILPLFSLKNVLKRGSLDTWKDTVARRADGNSVLIAAISLAFAGPLLRIIGRNGFGIHFKGKSSTGKTTALIAATSVWGGSDLMQTWRTTSNALEGMAASANDMFLPLDELGEAKAVDASDACYLLANGQAKNRARPQGCTGMASTWKTVVLSTGEISVAEKLAEANIKQMEGQIVRMMDLKADGQAYGIFDNLHGASDAASFAKEVNESATQACGFSGPAFVEKLTEFSGDIHIFLKRNVKQYTTLILKGVDISEIPFAPRVAEQFAIVALAGEMATRFGLTGWKDFTAIGAASEMFKIWIIGQHNPLSESEILRRIQEAVAMHDARLQ
ncbi:DUF927 domain-containing protein [Loktanella salsilacus]|uniref:DUF927 domain-containing protein n=1 Tax=Loktanella salsilacus TaxID=195913 RepID=UPI003703C17B